MDGCTFFGYDRQTGESYSISDLRAQLERIGVRAALVTSIAGIQHHYAAGNAETIEAVSAERDFFLPMAVVTAETFLPGSGAMDEIAQRGFAAVSIFPGWPDTLSFQMEAGLEPPTFAQIFKEAESANLPILVGLQHRKDLEKLGCLAASISTPVLFRWMSSAGYSLVPDILSLARTTKNLLFDISFAVQSDAIEMLVSEIGSERLFTASGAPLYSGAAAPLLVLGSNINDENKQALITGTLSNVFSHQVDPYVEPKKLKDFRLITKFDGLWHSRTVGIVNPLVSAQDYLVVARRWGISSLVVSSFDAIFGLMKQGNTQLADWLLEVDGMWGLVAVHPRSCEESLREIERHSSNPKFVGIKLLQDTAYGLSLDDHKVMDPIFDSLRRFAPDWSVLAHPPGLAQAAARNTDLTFICEHAIWRYPSYAELDNVYYDFTTSTTDTRVCDLSDFIQTVPHEKILFGSDAPMIDPAIIIGKLWDAGCDTNLDWQVLNGNLKRAYPRIEST